MLHTLLADSNFHGHRPAVSINQHLFWESVSIGIGRALTRRSLFHSRHASSAYQSRSGPPWHFRHSTPGSTPTWASTHLSFRLKDRFDPKPCSFAYRINCGKVGFAKRQLPWETGRNQLLDGSIFFRSYTQVEQPICNIRNRYGPLPSFPLHA